MRKGVKVTHFILFKPKYPDARMTATINISLDDTELLESRNFWPEGESRRKWMCQTVWNDKIESRNQKDEENEQNDYDEDA